MGKLKQCFHFNGNSDLQTHLKLRLRRKSNRKLGMEISGAEVLLKCDHIGCVIMLRNRHVKKKRLLKNLLNITVNHEIVF